MAHSYEISGRTEIYAVLGNPIKHSLSPLIHNTAFASKNMDKVYIALETIPNKLPLVIDMMRAFNIKGINLTMPLKEEVINYLDKLSPEAELIGAVNCVHNRAGILTGYNTDSKGFALSVLNKKGTIPKTAFVLGAGGVAKAIVVQLALQGVKKIYITNRNIDRANALAAKVSTVGQTCVEVVHWDTAKWEKIIPMCGIIINATSFGMRNNGDLALLIPWQSIHKDVVIYETIYDPLETAFLKHAKNLNLMTVEGIDLLLYQAAIAFKIWTGVEMPLNIVKNNITKYLMK